MRAVLDANVLISFLLTGGETISSIIDFWEEGRFTLLVSRKILKEIERTTKRFIKKGAVDENEARELLWRLRTDAELIAVHSRVSVSKDKKDNRYLACSKDGKADYLVTGDKKHLLPLEKFGATKIIPPKEFVKILIDTD